MEISAVQSTRQIHFRADSSSKNEDTSWKVHALVVLGRGMQIAATALVLSSLVFTWIATPFWLLGLIPAAALAVLGTKLAQTKASQGHLFIPGWNRPPFIEGQPIGIHNQSCNCWINSLMQVFLHVKSFDQAAQSLPASFKPLKDFIAQYHDSQQKKEFISGGDSQKIRECLHGTSTGVISNEAWRQEDASEGLSLIFNYANGSKNPLWNIVDSVQNSGTVTHGEYMIPLDLEGHKKNFHELLNTYFIFANGNGPGRRYFQQLPQELLFQCNRFTQVDGKFVKIPDSLPIEEEFSLPAEYVRTNQSAKFCCDAFIEHIGSALSGGHYVAYVKKSDGTWWCCNDSLTYTVSSQEARKAMQRAYLLHYRRA